jgi:hypothetical protein
VNNRRYGFSAAGGEMEVDERVNRFVWYIENNYPAFKIYINRLASIDILLPRLLTEYRFREGTGTERLTSKYLFIFDYDYFEISEIFKQYNIRHLVDHESHQLWEVDERAVAACSLLNYAGRISVLEIKSVLQKINNNEPF